MANSTWTDLLRKYEYLTKLQSFVGKPVFVEEIGDGNLNDVIRLYTTTEGGDIDDSVIIKRSLPYIKCLGPSYPLSEKRMTTESKALEKFDELAPGSVPKPFFYDLNTYSVCMQDLRGYELLRKLLMKGELSLDIVVSIARNLAEVHRGTHISTIGQSAMDTLNKEFENSDMCELSKQYIFTRPFNQQDETNHSSDPVKERLDTVYKDKDVLDTASKMLKIFQEKKECLIHGDLHTGSVLVKGSDAKLIDMEFGFVGPAAFDLGTLIANYIFAHYRHISIEENNDEGRKFSYLIIEACKATMHTYLATMTAPVEDRQQYEANLLSETAGFAGCEIVRRLVGAAHNADLEGMGLAEQDCLGAGVRLLQATHRIDNIDRLLVIALMLA